MKIVHKLATALLSMFVLGAASAAPIPMNMTSVASVSSPINLGVGGLARYDFTYSFLVGAAPFVIGFDTITAATLTISLDDTGRESAETFRFVFGSESYSGSAVPNSGQTYTFSLTSALAGLNSTGQMNVAVIADSGDFRLKGSNLSIAGTRGVVAAPPAQIPEPLSIALLGLGLAGMSLARRRK